MTNTLEQNRKIIADAPEEVFTAVHNIYSDEWLYSNQRNLRSLDDIRENIALQEEVLKYQERIAELEKQVEFEMGQKSVAREQRNKVTKRNSELEDELTEAIEVIEYSGVDYDEVLNAIREEE